jgi:hypothetical protein
LSPRGSRAVDPPRKSEPKPAATSQPVTAPQPDTATYELVLDDMEKFRPGRPRDEILKEIHWVGNFEMATEDRGKTLAAIGIYVQLKDEEYSDTLWAIFEDDEFQKFVEMPTRRPRCGPV